MEVEIEYCVQEGFLEPAIETQRALLSEFGPEIEGVCLLPGDEGVFTVAVDGETVFDRAEDGDRIALPVVAGAVADRGDA